MIRISYSNCNYRGKGIKLADKCNFYKYPPYSPNLLRCCSPKLKRIYNKKQKNVDLSFQNINMTRNKKLLITKCHAVWQTNTPWVLKMDKNKKKQNNNEQTTARNRNKNIHCLKFRHDHHISHQPAASS